jgi:branched-chain amino acid transport system substrate-binding protein
MNYKKTLIIPVLAVIVIVMVAFKLQTGDSSTIKIGSISSLVGTGSAIGQEERNGALLAVEQINGKGGIDGRMIELVSEDLSFDNLKLAPAVASKLADVDKVHAVVGPQWDEPTEAAISYLEKSKIPTVSGDVTRNIERDKSYEYLFSTWYDNRVGIEKILAYASSTGIKRVAIIRPVDGGFWKYTADLFTQYAAEYGVTVIDDVSLSNPFTTEYRTTLTKIKAKNPEAIFIVVTDPTQCPFMKQVRELGIQAKILGTEASGSYSSLAACGDLLGNLYFGTPAVTTSGQSFESAYEKRFGRKPQYPSAITAYDAVGVIAKALEETDGARGEELRNAIARTKAYRGASQEEITFDEKGFAITPSSAWQVSGISGGAFVKAK